MKLNAKDLIKAVGRLSKQKRVFVPSLVLVMGISTALAFATNNEQKAKPAAQGKPSDKLVLSRFDEMQGLLKTLADNANKPLPKINLKEISAQMELLSNHLVELREADNQLLAEKINDTQKVLGQELHSIKKVVTHLDSQKSPIKYLPVKILPFSIVSIDSIQQTPVASVAYDYKTIPLEKGDALAGWKVVAVDYGKQRLELENSKAERVLVTHEHVG